MAEAPVVPYSLFRALSAHGFTDEYSPIGSGAFGEVLFVKQTDGQFSAVKHSTNLENVYAARAALREIQVLRVLNHENIIHASNAIGMTEDGLITSVALVLEPMDFSLHDAIYRLPEGLTVSQVEFITYSIARALYYIHSGGIVHRDLKPANILLRAGSFDVKICDFGLARYISDAVDHQDLSVYPVTRYYRAPEVLAEQDYSTPLDLWSLGCIIAEMFNRRVLFQGGTSEGAIVLCLPQYRCIVHTLGSPNPDEMRISPSVAAILASQPVVPRRSMAVLCPKAATNPDALSLLDKLLVHSPRNRLTAEQVLQHPFVATSFVPQEEPRLPGPLAFPNAPTDVAQLQAMIKELVVS